MKNLENIPKNHPFKVPEGYFDKLPNTIQSRISTGTEQKVTMPYFRYALQYALPILVILVVAVFYFKPAPQTDANSLLASVSTDELVAYLEESEMTTDELIESVEFDTESVEAVESEVYLQFNLNENNLNDLNVALENL